MGFVVVFWVVICCSGRLYVRGVFLGALCMILCSSVVALFGGSRLVTYFLWFLHVFADVLRVDSNTAVAPTGLSAVPSLQSGPLADGEDVSFEFVFVAVWG